MYNVFRGFCERLLRIPADPQPPPGDESTTRVFHASPKYLKYLLVLWGLQSAIALLPILVIAGVIITIAATVEKHINIALVVGIAVVILLLVILQRLVRLALVRLDYEKRWYVVTDRSLRVREGVVQVQEMTITFANIQNISISQGPIQRLLGIADLRVDTAGGGGGGDGGGHSGHPSHDLHTAWFRGVDNANEVRALIQERLRHLKDSGLGDHDEPVLAHVPASAPVGMLEALREVHREAEALRRSVRLNDRPATPRVPSASNN